MSQPLLREMDCALSLIIKQTEGADKIRTDMKCPVFDTPYPKNLVTEELSQY